jgi:MFS family permease
MNEKLKREINQNFQIKKFSAYGFLKNLKFFEPYLVIYLLGSGLTLFQIGILYSIREAITYIFEIPSGIIADYYGRKKELYMCFSFYIISFLFFFFGNTFVLIAVAMVFFGLGEAFRSGTHKAMIYTYLEEKGWSGHKAYVYGRTRSFSLTGSAVSSLLAIIFILNVPSSRYIFLASIIPYILDLLLIMSYPESLDQSGIKRKKNEGLKIKEHLSDIYNRPKLRHILLNTALFDSTFKSTKDLIQPILEAIIIGSGFMVAQQFSPDENLKIILGISYGLIYIISASASRRAYLLKQRWTSIGLLNCLYLILVAALGILFLAIEWNQALVIIVLFLVLYLLMDIRKPIFVDACDDYMDKHQRATVLSIASQLRALFTIIMAPLVGFIADKFGLGPVMLGLGILLLLLYSFVKVRPLLETK